MNGCSNGRMRGSPCPEAWVCPVPEPVGLKVWANPHQSQLSCSRRADWKRGRTAQNPPFFRRASLQNCFLVHEHCISKRGVLIEPGGVLRCHVDTAFRPIVRKGAIALILVRKVRAGTIAGSPPAVVKEVAAHVVFHSIVNAGIRIPVGRPLWFSRFEDRG